MCVENHFTFGATKRIRCQSRQYEVLVTLRLKKLEPLNVETKVDTYFTMMDTNHKILLLLIIIFSASWVILESPRSLGRGDIITHHISSTIKLQWVLRVIILFFSFILFIYKVKMFSFCQISAIILHFETLINESLCTRNHH